MKENKNATGNLIQGLNRSITTIWGLGTNICLLLSIGIFFFAMKTGDLYSFYASSLLQTLAIILFITERFCQAEIFARNMAKALLQDMREELKARN